MPTRRTLELIVITVVALKPVFGLIRLWSAKTLATTPPSTAAHQAAEVVHIVTP